MIGVVLQLASEIVEVRVSENNINFRTGSSQAWATIEGLQLSHSGVLKEFPDLEGDPEWRVKAVNRFKEKVNSFRTEEQKIDYIVEDLAKHGYTPKYKQKQGHRPERLA